MLVEQQILSIIFQQKQRVPSIPFHSHAISFLAMASIFSWLTHLRASYGSPLVQLVGLGYWIQGFRCFPWFVVNFFFKDVLSADPGTLQIVQSSVNLPMVAKPVYGIVSDTTYIRGAHRVPYLVIGGLIQVLSWGAIVLLPTRGSSVSLVAILLALSNMGASVVDVANDALVAECGKKKRSSGELQSFAWFSAATGSVLGHLLAALALSRVDFKMIFAAFALLVSFQVCKSFLVDEGSLGLRSSLDIDKKNNGASDLTAHATKSSKKHHLSPRANSSSAGEESFIVSEALSEKDHLRLTGIRQQITELVHLLKKKELSYPLAWFMASYALIPTLAGTMFFFQTQHLKIDPFVIALTKVLGQMGLMAATVIYDRYLKGMSLRKLLGSVQVVLCLCMLFDVLLVKRINISLGIPDSIFVLGASAFIDAINQFKILPFTVLLAQLCPAGKEGSLLAAFMSMQCLATIISGYFGVTLTSLLHITSQDLTNLPVGICLEAMATLVPLMWISWIPGSKVFSLEARDGGKVT